MSAPKDDRVYLWDMLTAAQAVVSFVKGRTLEEYVADLMLWSAVERQVETRSTSNPFAMHPRQVQNVVWLHPCRFHSCLW